MEKREAEIILHASGLSRSSEQYRVHFCTDEDDPMLCKLASEGYFSGPHKSAMLPAKSAMFYLTKHGIETAHKLKSEQPSDQS